MEDLYSRTGFKKQHPSYIVQLFGPFKIKFKRSEVKRYGAMFTCLASRAVHT